MNLKGKSFIITGGGSGLGEATARLFAEGGAHVVVTDIQKDKGEQVADEIGGKFIEVDVTKEDQVKRSVDFAIESFGALHGAVSCAGIGGHFR